MNRKRRIIALPAVGVLIAAALGVPGANPAAAAPPGLLPAGKTYQVTLLSGDVVTVRGTASGCPVVSVKPAARSGVLQRSCDPHGHVHVVPARVAPMIGDRLDPALFDVTALILDGYDDARTKELPLIVKPGGGTTSRLAATALTGRRELPSIGAVAGRHAKSAGSALLGSLTTARAAAPSKIWLDRRVRATYAPGAAEPLDGNLSQISAPAAWAAGYTGRGTTVAVLDTGVDATHPDLAGQIADRMDFIDEGGDAVDHYGHGTHVAATIAGTGAAAGGARKGVAPGARLIVGKVLDDFGDGTDSQVIAGMEWAAPRAAVVNMSLGGYEASDGTDPLSLAVDALTRQTGALFVVAAGNDGPADGTISAPAAAASALTVGAVDGDDRLAEFSGRGPLIGTHAAKPELVAPGVDIVAARAAGTNLERPIDERYVAASGTSMATPHVAGAAAVLAQRHPDWKADRLKAALIGAADPVPAGDPYAVGAGRLDVARPLSGVVGAAPVAGLGTFTYPPSGTAETKLTWANTGSSPARVALAVTAADHNGGAAPAGAVTLSARDLALAAGATGGVTLRVDRAAFAGRPGLYTALVTARSGNTTTRTPVAFYVEPPSYNLTMETTAIPGTPDGSDGWSIAHVVNLDDPAVYAAELWGSPGDTLEIRVPAGRYSVMASFYSYTDDGDERAAMGGDPDIRITGDTAMKLDLSRARRLTASVDGVTTETSSLGLTYLQTGRRGPTWSDYAFAWGKPAQEGNVFVLPNDGAGVGSFRVYSGFSLNAPGRLYDLVHPFPNGIPADPSYRVTAAEQARLARIDQHFNLLDGPGSTTGHKRYALSPEGAFIAENTTRDLTGDRTDYVSPGVSWLDEAFWNDIVTQEAPTSYTPGSRQEKTWVRQPLRADWFDDPQASPSGCVPAAPSRTSGNIHVELATLIDQHQRFDCLSDGFGLDLTRKLTLERDGRTVGTATNSRADFVIPHGTAGFRLTYDVDATASLPVSTRTTTAWTFRSAAPAGTGSAPLPLLAVDYALPLDRANHPLPTGSATFTVRQAHGVRAQTVTSFTVATSLDGGTTWQPATVTGAGGDTFRASLPQPAAGGSVSLRVTAQGSAGSGVDQTIIDAYRAG